MDEGPDQKYLNGIRHRSTQTDADELYQYAETIVQKFDIIEAHWKRIEKRQVLYKGLASTLGFAFGLYIKGNVCQL